MFVAEWITTGLSNERYRASIDSFPSVAWQAAVMTGMIGLPVAFATSLIFALIGELTGFRQLWYAVLASMIVLLLSQFFPALTIVWTDDISWVIHILAYLILPSIVTWLILHRWTALLRS